MKLFKMVRPRDCSANKQVGMVVSRRRARPSHATSWNRQVCEFGDTADADTVILVGHLMEPFSRSRATWLQASREGGVLTRAESDVGRRDIITRFHDSEESLLIARHGSRSGSLCPCHYREQRVGQRARRARVKSQNPWPKTLGGHGDRWQENQQRLLANARAECGVMSALVRHCEFDLGRWLDLDLAGLAGWTGHPGLIWSLCRAMTRELPLRRGRAAVSARGTGPLHWLLKLPVSPSARPIAFCSQPLANTQRGPFPNGLSFARLCLLAFREAEHAC